MYGEEYVPTIPINESRAAITAIVTPPTAFMLSQGEAGTPSNGRLAFTLARLSDERTLTDNAGNVYASDGEVQMATLEYVSPRLGCTPLHLGASVTAFTLNDAWLDGIRNWIEQDLLSADPGVIAAHDIGGRELSVTRLSGARTDLLGSSPMWKLKAYAKLDLPDLHPGCSHLRSAFSVGVTAPAFGSHSESANRDVQVDACLAWAAPLADRVRWTGAFSAALPGGSKTYDDLGLQHEKVIFGANMSIEYWFSWRFAMAFGVSFNSSYTKGSGLPTDLASWYGNVGMLYRLSPRSDLHLIFAENFDTQINTAFGSDFSKSQKDADFTLSLGWSLSL